MDAKISNIMNERLVEIVFNKKETFNSPLIIEGFSGVGLVGTISAQYIIEQMELEEIGRIENELIVPVCIMNKGMIKYPIRVYSNKKRNIVVFETELPLPPELIRIISKEIVEFAKKTKAKEIICMDAIAVSEVPDQTKVFGVVNSREMEKKYEKKIKMLESGIIMGVSACVLLYAKEEGIPAVCIMSESHTNFPDGKAASSVINTVEKTIGIDIDTKKLEQEAAKFESKLKGIVDKAKTFQQQQRVMDDPTRVMFG